VEEPSLDRAALRCRTLSLSKAVDARGEQGLEGRGDLDLLTALGLHRRELLDEERVALSGLDDALSRLDREIDELCHERLAVALGQGLERNEGRIRLRCGPDWSHLEEVWSRRAEHEHRDVLRERCDVLDEIEERRLCPVNVVEDDDERRRPCQLLEQPADTPCDLLGRNRCARHAECGLDPDSGELGVAHALERIAEAPDLGGDLLQGPVGDSFAIREAAADDDARRHAPEQLTC
jgi:hypothetical protein